MVVSWAREPCDSCIEWNATYLTLLVAALPGQEYENTMSHATYRNVPPENRSTQPVANVMPSSPPNLLLPRRLTAAHVPKAPTGAARLKTARWARAARLEKPCFRRTEVRPKAAGALWSMIARNTTNPRACEAGPVVEAPRAMPSAIAWMISPIDVAGGRERASSAGRGVSGSVGELEW